MIDVNYKLVVVATIAQFVLGALWYSPLLFGGWWMRIMDCVHMSKEELKKMQKEMMPFYGLQLFLTLFMTISLANLAPYLTDFSMYHIAFWLWIGFIAPTQIAGVIWGSTKKKYWLVQIGIMVSYSLIGLLLASFILSA